MKVIKEILFWGLFFTCFANIGRGAVAQDYEDVFGVPTDAPSSKSRTENEQSDEDAVDENCNHDEKCVAYYLCKEDGKVNSDGSFIIDERNDGPKQIPVTCPSLEMCCQKSIIIQFNNTLVGIDVASSSVTESSSSTTSSPQTEKLTCANVFEEDVPTENASSDDVAHLHIFFPPPLSCGYRNEKGVGGQMHSVQNQTQYANYAEFPWMMAILVERVVDKKTFAVYQCGGSLIHPKVVLTTAHNIAGISENKLVVRAGEWDTQSENEMFPHKERKVQNVIRHEQFTRQNLQNDVALLVLDKPFQMTSAINTICLPPLNTNFDGQRCWSSGWGKNKFGKQGTYQAFLKKVDLPIVSSAKCQDQMRLTRLGDDFILHDKLLCAGGEKDKDLCTGDGGSPLVCSIPSKPELYYQAGIVVGGIGCGVENIPGFYADVSKYRDWIDKQITGLGLNSCHYSDE